MTDPGRRVDLNNRSNYIEKARDVVFQYGEKTIPKIIGHVPIFPEVFLGREDDMVQIKKHLAEQSVPLLLVNGEGGIGKTTVASVYYHGHLKDYQHLIWMFVKSDIKDALLNLALPLQIKFDDRIPEQDRLDKIAATLLSLQSPSLLIIDNANDLKSFKAAYPVLRRLTSVDMIITTRISNYSKARVYPIKALEKEKAIELFMEHYEQHSKEEDRLLQEVLSAVGYNTLVIEVLAKNLSCINNGLEKKYPLKALLVDLQTQGVLALTQSREVETDYQLEPAQDD